MDENQPKKWYVMRDLKRRNALKRAYQVLDEKHFEVFTPMHWVVTMRNGKRVRAEEPVISDLLFVYEAKDILDPVVSSIPTLQYRYRLGHSINEPTTVREADMERFIRAVANSQDTRYYLPEEIRPEMLGRNITIIGGPLCGYSGKLLALKGARKKRLLVEIPDFVVAAVEVNPEFIQFV